MEMMDIFVGGVSIALGVVVIGVAVINAEAAFRLATAKQIEKMCGRSVARALFVVIGISLVVVGTAVIAGFAPGWLSIPYLETP